MVRLLLEASADKAAAVDCSDYGMTALHLAAQSGHTEVVRRLWRPVLTKIQPIALSLSAPASSKKTHDRHGRALAASFYMQGKSCERILLQLYPDGYEKALHFEAVRGHSGGEVVAGGQC